MVDSEDSLEGTSQDLAKLLVHRGIITAHQCDVALKQYEDRKGTPREQSLERILMAAGFVQDERFLDNLRIQTKAFTRCAKCGKLYTIIYYNPASVYVCKKCGGKLDNTEAAEATIVADTTRGKTTGTTSSLGTLGTGSSSAFEGTGSLEKAVFTTSEPRRDAGVRVPPEVEAARQDPKRIFGKYTFVKELGRGGTAIVYKAWDTSLAQFCALKLIKIDDVEDSSSSVSAEATSQIRDFQREARMSARFRHPNIIRIYELGCIDNKHYLAMELMEGPTLAEVIHGSRQRNAQTRFPAESEKLLTILRDVARAVHYAHTQAPPVIHRDLKPQNVLLDTKGVAYVADFGLAKEAEIGRSDTVTGVVKGTPSYMAPEQAEGHNRDTDQRTDVYALGAILYEMLTGRPPFIADNVRMVLNQIVTRIPDRPNDVIARVNQEQPEGQNLPKPVAKQLETIALKCLEKKKTDRYQSAQEVADDLDRFLQNMEIEAREPSVVKKAIRRMKAHPIISGSVGAVLLAGAVAFAAVYFRPKEKGGVDVNQIVAIASDHEKAGDWSSLKADIESLRKLDPKNSRIAEFEKAMTEHEGEKQRRQREWGAGLDRLKSETSWFKALNELRAPYRDAGELREEFWDKLERVLVDLQISCLNDARKVAGSPRDEWLKDEVKGDAKLRRERIVDFLALEKDTDFPFKKADKDQIESSSKGLDGVVNYLGIWQLRVNLAPYAEVVLRRNGKDVVQEWTPLGLHDLEVGSGYELQIFWPSREAPQKTAKQELKNLRHGGVVVITGEVDKPQILQ